MRPSIAVIQEPFFQYSSTPKMNHEEHEEKSTKSTKKEELLSTANWQLGFAVKFLPILIRPVYDCIIKEVFEGGFA